MHFTYSNFPPESDLEQGDLLKRSPTLNAAIEEFHRYYVKADYTHFMVLTQSCDLVSRPGQRTRYINLGAVRALPIVLEREANRWRSNPVLRLAGGNSKKFRPKLQQFLEKLLNNNHMEYFYLHEEPTVGLTERSCAFLRLSVALRSEEHYETCRQARIARLTPAFQNKLGWLLGSIYSRVGTEDWSPAHRTPPQWQEIIDGILDQELIWFEEEVAKVVEKRHRADVPQMTAERAKELLAQTIAPKKKETVIEAVIDELKNKGLLAPEGVDKARRQLTNSPVLTTLLK